MISKTLQANLLLLLAAAIWGIAFVPQKTAMEHIGPFWFTGLRFALGALVILPLVLKEKPCEPVTLRSYAIGIGIGLFLFIGINLQQIALQYTSVTNSGFITGLYVVLVPLFSLLHGHRYGIGLWAGAILATIGLYLLSVKDGLSINTGDVLTLLSAICWTFQVIALSSYGKCLPPVRLAFVQFLTCIVLSLAVAMVKEPVSLAGIRDAGGALLYCGILSVGVAFTLQAVAQRNARAAHAAIILSMEAALAAFAGWLFLNEILGSREMLGCALMMAGTLLAQLSPGTAPEKSQVQEA